MQKDCNSIKIFLAGDMPLLRDGLRYVLHNSQNMEVVGAVSNYKELHTKALELQPDVIITGAHLADTNGLENIARLESIELILKKLISQCFHSKQKYISSV